MLVVCVGTGTEVGKTWVGAETLRTLAADGRRVAARKPAQSFDPADARPTDADVLAAATGDAPEDVCPPHRWYRVAMAPPMAAEQLGLPPPTIADLVEETRWPTPEPDICWVESAGGVRSPLAADGDSVDLCAALGAQLVVLVADAGLGVINAVRLTVAALAAFPTVVYLNRFGAHDPLHRANRAWLTDRDGLRVVTTPADLAGALAHS